MGHWTEGLADEAAERLPKGIDRDVLLAALRTAGDEIETLTGQSFGPVTRNSVSIATFGLPFVELHGLLIGGGVEGSGKVWPIPNPVDGQRATVVQVGELVGATTRSMPVADALGLAGKLLHDVTRSGGLSGDAVMRWLGRSFSATDRVEFMRGLFEPSNHVHIPVTAGGGDGWWFQITRRLMWLTEATEEHRLVEPLIPQEDDALGRLVAVEPLLIVARVTQQPADWAMAVRIWPSIERPGNRPWRGLAQAIHGHGIPILTLDPESTSEELQAQLLMLAHWHRYIGADDYQIADAIASAYPKPVERVMRGTSAPGRRSAGAMLFAGLLQPGFDPAMGAAAARRYVSRKATIAILNHRKATNGGVRVWESLGVSERRYFKLLGQFAPKVAGRYQVDEGVLKAIHNHLVNRDQRSERQKAAMEVLQQRGFGYAAARKWLQRHDHAEALTARPRLPRASMTWSQTP
jgi:hypothetical protein